MEILLTLIVIGFGTTALSLVKGIATKNMHNIAVGDALTGYIMNSTDNVFIVNWGEDNKVVELICVSSGGILNDSSLEVPYRSAMVTRFECNGTIILISDNGRIPTLILQP